MVSKTVEDVLREYQIGEKVHALRMRKKMGLVELGKHTGLSPGLLSKIERSRLFPPLGTIVRIALVFGVGLEYFFTDDRKRHTVAVVRKGERKRFPANADAKAPSYFFESLDYPATERVMSGYLADFEELAPEDAQPHVHEGFEILYLTSGKLAIRIGREEHELAQGDSIYFDASVPHSYRRVGAKRCQAVVVTSP